MKKFYLILIILTFCLIFSILKSYAQQQASWEWAEQINCEGIIDRGTSITTDNNNNIYVAGIFYEKATFTDTSLISYGDEDIFIAKYDSSENLIYIIQAGGIGWDEVYSIFNDNTGSIYITGLFNGTATFGDSLLSSNGNGDIFIAKFNDLNGTLKWARKAGGNELDVGFSIKTDNFNNVYVTGCFKGTAYFGNDSLITNGDYDIFIVKYDKNGNLIWLKQAGGSSFDVGISITTDKNNYIYVTGHLKDTAIFENDTITSNGDRDIFISKYDTSGNLIWLKHAGGIGIDKSYSIITDNNNNVYVAGSFQDIVSFENETLTSNGNFDIFIIKYDYNGNFIWVKQAGGNESDEAYYMTTNNTYNYGIYITGLFKGTIILENDSLISNGSTDIFVAKYDYNGNFIWAKQAGGNEFDCSYSIVCNKKNNVFITGKFTGTAYFDDIYLSSIGNSIFIAKLEENTNKINEIKNNSFYNIYPNPSNGIFNIYIKNENINDLIIELMNINCQIVYRNEIKNVLIYNDKINVQELAKGIYFLKIQRENKINYEKLIFY